MYKVNHFVFLMIIVIGIPGLSAAQITEQQVDELNQEIFPLYTNLQTYNSPTGFQIPGGEYTYIFTTAAGHHTDSTSVALVAVTDHYHVTPEQQAIADGDPLRHLWVYDREQYATPEQYADSLHSVLSEYFLISGLQKQKVKGLIFYPNPVATIAKVIAKESPVKSIRLVITDSRGKTIEVIESASTDTGIEEEIDFSNYKRGLYLIRAEGVNWKPIKVLVI